MPYICSVINNKLNLYIMILTANELNILGGIIQYDYSSKKDIINVVYSNGKQKKLSLSYGKRILNKKSLPIYKNTDIFIYTENRNENGAKTSEKTLIDRRFYDNMTNKDTLKFFRRLGGSETAQRTYTCNGYLITRLLSKSPDRSIKVERLFKAIR